MQINKINLAPNYNNFKAKLKNQDNNKDDDDAQIIFNDGTMPYEADMQLTKTSKDGFTSSEYFKDGVYIIHETISPMKHTTHPFEANYQEVEVFDRQKAEHISKRRYDNGKVDVLVKGTWTSKNRYEIEHQDENGNTTGYTRREYLDYEAGQPYWGYDFYCRGDIYFRYLQTRFDKNHKPIGVFEGLETVKGKKIKSL